MPKGKSGKTFPNSTNPIHIDTTPASTSSGALSPTTQGNIDKAELSQILGGFHGVLKAMNDPKTYNKQVKGEIFEQLNKVNEGGFKPAVERAIQREEPQPIFNETDNMVIVPTPDVAETEPDLHPGKRLTLDKMISNRAAARPLTEENLKPQDRYRLTDLLQFANDMAKEYGLGRMGVIAILQRGLGGRIRFNLNTMMTSGSTIDVIYKALQQQFASKISPHTAQGDMNEIMSKKTHDLDTLSTCILECAFNMITDRKSVV